MNVFGIASTFLYGLDMHSVHGRVNFLIPSNLDAYNCVHVFIIITGKFKQNCLD